MEFSFNPKSDEEINEIQNQGLLPEGVYPFTVKELKPRVSKTGNNMLEVRLGVLEKDGSERNIFDYLVSTDKMIFKLKHFCESIGFEAEYNAGKFNINNAKNRSGNVLISIQKGSPNDNGGFYPDKNSVKDYVVAQEKVAENAAKVDPDLNDDIEF